MGGCCNSGNGWYDIYWGGEKLDHTPFNDGKIQTIMFGECKITHGPTNSPTNIKSCEANEKMFSIKFMTNLSSNKQNEIIILRKKRRGWKNIEKIKEVFPKNELYEHDFVSCRQIATNSLSRIRKKMGLAKVGTRSIGEAKN